MSDHTNNPFIGPLEALTRLSHADVGGIAVVIKNGTPERVVTPSRRIARGFRAPLIGALQVVQVNTGLVSFDIPVTNIRTSDAFALSSLIVDCTVRLDPTDDYEALRKLITQHGMSFGDGIIKELRAAIERHVRTSFKALSADDIYGETLHDLLGAQELPIRIGNGLLVLTHLLVEKVVWHPKFIEREQLTAELAVIPVRTEVQVAEQHQEAAVARGRLEAYAPLALELGVPVELLADPQRRQMHESRVWDLVMKLVEPGNRSLLQRYPDLLESARAFLAPSGVNVGPLANRPDINQLADQARQNAAIGPGASSTATGSADAELNLDRRLVKAWGLLGVAAEDVLGTGSAAAGDRAVSLLVTRPGVDPGPSAAVTSRFSALLDARKTTVVVMTSFELDEILKQAFKHLDEKVSNEINVRSVVTEVDGIDGLEVYVGSTGAAARKLVSQLNDPAEPTLGALEDMLSFARIDVRLDPKQP